MNGAKTIIGGLLFALLVTTTSCLSYKEVMVDGVHQVVMKKMSTKGIEVEVTMKVHNPNKYKITMADADLDVFINGIAVGKAKVDNKVVLPKKSYENHTVLIKKDLSGISLKDLPALMQATNGSSVNVTVRGEIKARAFLISKKFPVEFTERVKIK